MKTIEGFIKEIDGSDDLQNAIKAIKEKDALAAFLKKYDVEGTVEDFVNAIKEKRCAEGEVSDDDIAAVAGGQDFWDRLLGRSDPQDYENWYEWV